MILSKVFNKIIIYLARKKGYSAFMASQLLRVLYDDFIGFRKVSKFKKINAYKKGFLSERVELYKINDTNINSYMPELPYLKAHPLNTPFGKWIDDKLTFRYVFSPFSEYLPKYFYQIKKDKLIRLIDCSQNEAIIKNETVGNIIKLLEKEGHLAVKPLADSGGVGFIKLEYNNGSFLINNETVTVDNIIETLKSLDGYIVTEYIFSHHMIQNIYKVSPNTIRVISVHDHKDGTQIVGAMMRFGTKKTGMVDNARQGGIVCGVKLDSGELYDARITGKGEFIKIFNHPDTNVPIKGYLPHWNEIIAKIKTIGNFYPQLVYVGYDLIITESGFKIIEINSHPEIRSFQMYYPLLENKYIVNIFKDKLQFN